MDPDEAQFCPEYRTSRPCAPEGCYLLTMMQIPCTYTGKIEVCLAYRNPAFHTSISVSKHSKVWALNGCCCCLDHIFFSFFPFLLYFNFPVSLVGSHCVPWTLGIPYASASQMLELQVCDTTIHLEYTSFPITFSTRSGAPDIYFLISLSFQILNSNELTVSIGWRKS